MLRSQFLDSSNGAPVEVYDSDHCYESYQIHIRN